MIQPDVTQMLVEWSNGDRGALNRLMPLVYEELRAVARHHILHESAGHTLSGTALVHEAYLRMVNQERVQWKDRAHFFAVAARMIRNILVDHARGRRTEKRGGSLQKMVLDEAAGLPTSREVDLVALDDALNALADLDTQQAQVVELRFFTGLTIPETAEALGVSVSTVQRHWVTAKAWLFDQMNGSGGDAR
ncbi:sigma-70 family RNA polymerase sigma factor [uncultured Paludibaculum sp.]|uniref:sigma-70 family RNA polymerase sigma factor n=1 Tax=uncultured Paludibaculum sp. TaxID=1765020 RepID=UPI002AAAF271|nr:sigma-70 family RNA polymerase sigma factor [uncultured Paludibaculum sp.]